VEAGVSGDGQRRRANEFMGGEVGECESLIGGAGTSARLRGAGYLGRERGKGARLLRGSCSSGPENLELISMGGWFRYVMMQFSFTIN
jgi:hypothetical protein